MAISLRKTGMSIGEWIRRLPGGNDGAITTRRRKYRYLCHQRPEKGLLSPYDAALLADVSCRSLQAMCGTKRYESSNDGRGPQFGSHKLSFKRVYENFDGSYGCPLDAWYVPPLERWDGKNPAELD